MNRISAATALLAGARATSTKWWFPPHRSISSAASGREKSIINENRDTYERKVLLPELSQNAVKLTCESSADGGLCNVYLVGTERSPESRQQIKDVIKFLKPQLKQFISGNSPAIMNGINRLNAASRLAAHLGGARATKWLFPPHRCISSAASQHNCQVDKNECEIDAVHRKMLPPELSWKVVKLTCESSADGGVCHVYLVGTIHFTAESCRRVRDVIKYLKPEVVFLEWCPELAYELRPSYPKAAGGEFRAAADEARKYGAKIMAGDRPDDITWRRLLGKISFWPILSLTRIESLLKVDRMKSENKHRMVGNQDPFDVVDFAIQVASVLLPNIMEVLVDERDRYMSALILKAAREHNSVVAVVGMGHLQGIRNNWKQPIDVKQLLDKPPIPVVKVLSYLLGVAIISGIYLSIKK